VSSSAAITSEEPLVEYANIQFAVEAGIARLTLNRPDKLNSFTGEMHAELRDALDRVQADKAARVLVLTGAGRAFCAGQDLADPDMAAVGGKMPDIGNVVEKNYKPLVLRLQNLRVPTIAAVNGIAAGAGASVALACDLVVATKSASFLQAFSKIGLIPDTGGTWFLPQRVGMARAMGLAMLADKLPAEKAADWGLIWAAYDDTEFVAKVDALAAQLAAMPTKALVRTRQAMHAAPGHTLEQQLSFEGGFMRELGWSPDYAEGVAAFMEKRAPRFTGE
jgi:2-(1,2-epoxy-1,2-dihydrophenyl)acetyl-CoA isomerase